MPKSAKEIAIVPLQAKETFALSVASNSVSYVTRHRLRTTAPPAWQIQSVRGDSKSRTDAAVSSQLSSRVRRLRQPELPQKCGRSSFDAHTESHEFAHSRNAVRTRRGSERCLLALCGFQSCRHNSATAAQPAAKLTVLNVTMPTREGSVKIYPVCTPLQDRFY